ncbi:unnamed protein product, partial [Polarella glacialis]
GEREAVEQALLCLALLGRRRGVWPELDVELSQDLSRLFVVFKSEAAAVFLEALLSSKSRKDGRVSLSLLGDVRQLRVAVKQQSSPAVNAAVKALEAIPGCAQCGYASEQALLVCGGCRAASYCSRDCQKAAWKSHKASCSKK